jgi:DNA-binding helix-hairpin-helix protein with protein kinase domain
MQQVRCQSDGRLRRLDTDARVARGGEACIYPVLGEPSLFAKVYHEPTPERGKKLEVMIANPPRNPTEAQKHRAYAWPSELITSPDGRVTVGFLMPRVSGMREIFDFYNPANRRKHCAYFDFRYLHQTARNLAGIIGALHATGYVIGDVSQRNCLVSDTAMVTMLDTDSYQIRDPIRGIVYHSRVSTPGFIAREIYPYTGEMRERTIEGDLFGLSVLIFLLLMEGHHPFSCKYTGTGESPPLQQSIGAGAFAFNPQRRHYGPMPSSPPLDLLHEDLRKLFLRSFVDGHRDPSSRPSTKDWQRALSLASKELRQCPRNPQHYYGGHLGGACPWCARVDAGLRDSFPRRPSTSARPVSCQAGAVSAPQQQSPANPSSSRTVAPFGPSARAWIAIAVVMVLAVVWYLLAR